LKSRRDLRIVLKKSVSGWAKEEPVYCIPAAGAAYPQSQVTDSATGRFASNLCRRYHIAPTNAASVHAAAMTGKSMFFARSRYSQTKNGGDLIRSGRT
jgi:hypothetical protein